MGEMSREKERKIVHELLTLWAGKEKEWLTYKQIVNELKRRGVSERTTVRYLNTLVGERKLMKEERGYKRTFYRPDEDFLTMLYPSLDWIRCHEEFLGQTVKDIVSSKFENAITSSKETYERIEKLISEEIGKISKETAMDDEMAGKAIYNVLSREKLSDAQSKTLFSLIERFLKVFYENLSPPYSCAGTIEQYVLISNLEREIVNLLWAYMDLWNFIYTVPGASFEFEKYLKEKLPFIAQ
jgi:hypothetical protein